MNRIEDAGFEAYAVGGCVRDSLLGRTPGDWDLTSNASRDTLEALFPDAEIVNKKLGVLRITEGGVSADVAAYRIDGEYLDYRRPDTVIFTQNIEEDLRRRDFTMNAVAFSPVRGVSDPFQGMRDIADRIIRGIGNPQERFEEDALRILRAARFAGQLGFALEGETLDAMRQKADLLRFISSERIREEFIKTITASSSGSGLRLLLETGVLAFVAGSDEAVRFSERETKQLRLLADRIDGTKKEQRMRLALFYLCLESAHASHAIDYLGYSNEVSRLLHCAVSMAKGLSEIRNKSGLKQLISRIGMEYYKFVNELSDQWGMIHGADRQDYRQREVWFTEIRQYQEPVFLADLALDGSDLKEAGLSEGPWIGWILELLLAEVHRDPQKNEKDMLLVMAAELKNQYNTERAQADAT